MGNSSNGAIKKDVACWIHPIVHQMNTVKNKMLNSVTMIRQLLDYVKKFFIPSVFLSSFIRTISAMTLFFLYNHFTKKELALPDKKEDNIRSATVLL